MSRIAKSTEILHDLLVIQNDRTTFYERLAKFPGYEETICKLLKKITSQSRSFILELRSHIDINYGDPADRVEIKGEIYHNWPGMKYFLPDDNYNEIFDSFECNEKATEVAYQKALVWGNNLCHECQSIISNHLKTIRESLAYIQDYKYKPAGTQINSEKQISPSFSRRPYAELGLSE